LWERLKVVTVVLAQMMDRGDTGGNVGHWWPWLSGLFFIVLAGIIVLVVWGVSHVTATNRGAAPPAPEPPRRNAEDILADRFARGEIDEDDYRRRADALRR
jgi:putative membrane protein